MSGELAVGVVTKLAASGITRVLGVLYAPIKRRQTIDRKTKDADGEATRRFTDAINDLRILLGNKYGQYTTSVDALFDELQRSSFPDLLTNAILIGAEPTAARQLFTILHGRYLAQEGLSSDELFKFVENAVRAQHELFSADRHILEYVARQTTELKDKLERSTSQICCMLEEITLSALSADAISIIRGKVSKALEAKYRYVPIETARGNRRYVISRLFIEPRFSCLDYEVLSGLGVKAKQNSTTEDDEEAVSEISYSLFRSTFHRTVILGDPGGGKSTTIQNLCFEFSKALSLAVEYPNRDDTDPFRQRMPLRVVLRALESRHTSNRSLNILDFIIDEISELVDEPRPVLEQFIRYSLATGTAIVLFDGLDEVLNVGSRRSYVGIVEQFSHQFPATGVLVTSRYVGYMDAPLSPDFQCLALARFKESEIEQYTRKLLSVVKVAKEKSLDSEVQSFLAQTSRNARDLRENPLMLALMVWLFAMKGDVPANRPEIYKECATLMFERWDPNRGILADIPTDFELLDLFGFVAHEILGKPDLEEGVTREWLLSKMQTYFVRWYEDKAKAHATASSLVGFLVGRAWVMSEVGAGLFKFTHRTFLEYFYAKYMNAQVDSVKELVSRLKHRIYSVQLDVVNHLSLQMFTFREPRKIHEAAVELTKIVEEDATPFEASNALNFFSRSLEYLVMSEQQFKACVEVMCTKMIDVGSTGETYVAQTLVHLCANSGTRFPIVVEVAKKVVTKAIRKKDEASLEFIANTLIGGRVRRRDKPSFATRIHSRSYISLMNELKLECLREITSRAKREVRLAALSAQLDPDLLPSLYQDHGAELLLVNWNSNIISIGIGLPAVLRALGAQAGLMLPDVPWVAANSKTLGGFFLKLLEDGFIKLPMAQSFEFGRDITFLLRRVFQPSPLASGGGVITGLSRGVVLRTSAPGPSVVLATSTPGRGIVQSTSTLGRFRQISDHGALGAFFLGIAVLCELDHALAPSDTSRSIRRADLILRRRKEVMLMSIPPNARHKFVDSARKWAQPGSAGLIEHRTVG